MAAPCYSERLDRALVLAAAAFRPIQRKGSGIPYLTHLLQVAVWVGEHGGDEDQMITAVLHDYLEDIDGVTAASLAEQFGERVAAYVVALSDSQTEASATKPPWRDRKDRYLARLRGEPAAVKLICCCDKLHNARSTIRDLGTVGDEVWTRFNVGPEQTLWYYDRLVESLADGWSHAALDELRAAVAELRARAGVEAS